VLTPLVKKLDKLIIKAFIGPFIAIFFITTFVLVLQFFWLYIDDVVGKGGRPRHHREGSFSMSAQRSYPWPCPSPYCCLPS